MANIQAATTTVTSLTNTIATFYDRILLKALDKNVVYHQFGTKKNLPKGEGKTIIWNRPTPLAVGFLLSEGVPISTANALSTTKVSALVSQFGAFTAISDFVSLTSIAEPMKLAAERLGAQAALTVDSVVRNEIVQHANTTANSAHNYYKTSTALFEYWGTASAVYKTVSSLNVISVSDIRTAVYSLRGLNVQPYEGNDYVAVMHPHVAADIVGDSTWINFHQYTVPGQSQIFNGEIGKIYGCRIVESTNAPISAGSSVGTTVSAMAYGTVIMGKDFYGVTELGGGIETFITQGASKSDPLNQQTTYGWKWNGTAKILNASCGAILWTGGSQNTTTDVADFNLTGATSY